MEIDVTTDPGSEAGMTLIEILMGVVLSGIMIAALVGGIMAYMRGASATTYLLNETPELQLVATTFGTDVQSADTITKPASGATPACGPTGDATVVDFRWSDYSSTTASVPVVVSYTYTESTHELRRSACRNGALADQTRLSTHIAPLQTPVLQCYSATCVAPDLKPTRVDLGLQVCTANDLGAACLDTQIPANYTAVRRLPS